jgi:hypothetical protein
VWGGTAARLYDHDDHYALTTKDMAAPRRGLEAPTSRHNERFRLSDSGGLLGLGCRRESEIDAYAQVKRQDGVFSRPPTGRHGIQIRPPVLSLPT